MARVLVYADESGNFAFNRRPGASRYFILGTITLRDTSIGMRLLDLRRKLAWQGLELESGAFHAAEDSDLVREAVFSELERTDFRFDATLLDKPKTVARLRQDPERFYKTAWYLHFKHVAPLVVNASDELFVIAATLGTRRKRRVIRSAIEDVVNQVVSCARWRVAFWPAESDPCLQIADYCTWAIQRRSERGDARWYDRIRPKVHSDFDAFQVSTRSYY